jgi:hypothetical protein
MTFDTPHGDTITIPTWLWVSVGSLALLVVGGIGTWVGTTLNDNTSRLYTAEAKIESLEKQSDRMEQKLDRILEAVRK